MFAIDDITPEATIFPIFMLPRAADHYNKMMEYADDHQKVVPNEMIVIRDGKVELC